MFMQIPIEGIWLQIGIQLAQSVSGKRSQSTKAFPYESGFTIELIKTLGTTNTTTTTQTELIPNFTAISEPLYEYIEVLVISTTLKYLQKSIQIERSSGGEEPYSVHFFFGVVTVRTLYAGTLVNFWTTAPSHQKRHCSATLLAGFCFILATLTIAARCYASKSATHPLAQLSLQPQSFSSLTAKDSKFQTHSSKIVLSRIFSSPTKGKDKQSDTRIIFKSSKNLLSTQNFKLQSRKIKREISEDKSINTFHSYDGKYLANEETVLYDVEVQSSTHKYPINSTNKTQIPSRSLRKERLPESNDIVTSENKSDKSAWNISENSSVSGTLRIIHRQNDRNTELLTEESEQPISGIGIKQPMPPVVDHNSNSFSTESAILVLVVSAVVLTVALGLVTCVLSHYRGGTAADPHDAGHTPTTAPMLSVVSAGAAAGVGGMDRLRSHGAARELAATRDRQVRLHAVHTDIAINLPPSIALPDGEDHPFNNSRLHIRDSEQESEIYQKCIKPPPNRTVLESESPPPYRSSSAGLLGSIGSSSSGSSDWSGGSAPLVMRCHSMSSTSKRPDAGSSGQKTDFIQRTVKIFTGKKSQPPPAPTLPAVVVPTRPRQTSEQQNSSGRPKPSV